MYNDYPNSLLQDQRNAYTEARHSTIPVICPWCQPKPESGMYSHTICEPCLAAETAKFEAGKKGRVAA